MFGIADELKEENDKLRAKNKHLKMVLKLAEKKIDALLDKHGYEYAGGMSINNLKAEIQRVLEGK